MYFANSWASGDDQGLVSDDVLVVVEVAEEFFSIVVDIVWLLEEAWA